MVGDHKQLPPTIISNEAARKGLAVTLLERVVHGLGENVVTMLTTQYRLEFYFQVLSGVKNFIVILKQNKIKLCFRRTKNYFFEKYVRKKIKL